MKKAKKYLLGIDLGTNSCGFCLCDENSHIVKKQGKYLWGVRMFEEAEDAKARKTFRASRRRLQRRNQRIKLLQELFAEEIYKVDQNFYKRLAFSQIKKEETLENGIQFDYSSTLFNDASLNDKIYFEKYPTIYHLRKELIENSDKKFDIREIYLACSHLLKHRGNFLYESLPIKGDSINFIDIIKDSYFEIFNYFDENFTNGEFVSEASQKTIEKYKNEHRITYRKQFLKENIFNEILKDEDNKNVADIFITLLSGSKVDFKKIFNLEILGCKDEIENMDDELLKKQFDFNDPNFDLVLEEFNKTPYLNDEIERFSKCIIKLKLIFDNLTLQRLLGDSKYISEAMVSKYESHQVQLKEFKCYIKNNKPELYNEIFREIDDKKNNYVKYIGSNNTNNSKQRFSKCSQEDFYKFIKDKLNLKNVKDSSNVQDEYLRKIYDLMNSNDFLVKQRIGLNSLFPYQLAEYELKTILHNQSKFYSFLYNEDKYGTTLEKIVMIISFKVPYYVGPLGRKENDSNHEYKKYSWAEFKTDSKEKITPWNFDEIVDKEASNKKFIQRMLNNCSYLHSDEKDCKCLPKFSPLLEYVNVLNELNKMLINKKEITFEQKYDLLKNLYLKKNKIKTKDIVEYLKNRYNESSITLNYSNSEKDFDIKHDLSSYNNLSKILNLSEDDNEEYLSKGCIQRLEDIILDVSIFEDKKLLEKHLLDNAEFYNLSNSQIKSIKGLNFKEFGRLSKKLLIDIHPIDENGEYLSDKNIIKEMIYSNKNFMELVGTDGFGFKESIEKFNIDHKKANNENDFIKDYVDELYVSPGMKRPLIQAYKIAKELEKIVDAPIDEFYIECTRSNKSKKEEKLSRKKKVEYLYNDAKKFAGILNAEDYKEIKSRLEKCDENKFRSDEIYLYFIQLGKDIYTKEAIDFDSLGKGVYDIDHIYPQSLVKDDSLTNRVLTLKTNNHKKLDNYPINYDIFGKNKNEVLNFQKFLYDKGLINKEKLNRLQRQIPLSDEELYNFVNRQIVYTSQSVKALKDVFESMSTSNHKVEVIMSKAEVVSDFRKKYDIIKSRDANNLHHAHDAFLNVVVGRTVDTYFTKNIFKLMNRKDNELDRKKYTTNVMKIFDDYKEPNHKQNIIDKEGVVWNYENDNTLKYIKEQIYKNFNILITTRTYKKGGLFSKVTIKSHDELKGFGIPTKSSFNENKPNVSDYTKYGGYSDLSFSNYMLIKGKKGKNEVYAVVTYPSLYIEKDQQEKFILDSYGIKDYEIIIPVLNVNTVFEIGKSKFCITGRSNKQFVIKNLKEPYFDYQSIVTIKKISKMIEKFTYLKIINKDKTISKDYINENSELFKNNLNEYIISSAKNKNNKEIIINKDELVILFNKIINLLSSDIYSQYTTFNSIKSKLIEKEDDIFDLNVLDFSMLIFELLKLLKTSRESSNLLMINESANSGILMFSSSLSNDCKIVFESVTGYYRKVVWENK